jgi:hypothetical protein
MEKKTMSVTGDLNGPVAKSVTGGQARPEVSSPSTGATARLLDKVFDRVQAVRVPPGATGLELRVDIGRAAGDPDVHVHLNLRAPASAPSLPAPSAQGGGGAVHASFGPKGHGTIGFIALNELATRAPDVRATVNAILGGRADPFVAANWADSIRNDRPETKPWHFVDIAYRPDAPDAVEPLPEAPHVLSQLAEMSEKVKTETDPELKADALCFIIHFLGDVHQPLHCVTRVTPEQPNGDRGGNDFRLSGHYRQLHSLWDDSVNLSLPDTAEDLAASIVEAHPRDSLAAELAVKEPEAWARATHALAVQFAYGPLEAQAGTSPTPDNAYLRTARDVGQRQAAIAGYRLADLLISLLGG